MELCSERIRPHTHCGAVLELVEEYGASGPEPFQRCLHFANCYMHRCNPYRWVLNMSSHGNAVRRTQWQYVYVSSQTQAVWNYIYVPKYMLCCLSVQPARLDYLLLSRMVYETKLLCKCMLMQCKRRSIPMNTEPRCVFMIHRLKWATQTRGYRLPKYLYKTQNTGMCLCTEACRDPQSFVDAPLRMYRKTVSCLSAEPASINRNVLHVWTHHTQGHRKTKSNGPLQTLARELRTKKIRKRKYGWRGEGGRSQNRNLQVVWETVTALSSQSCQRAPVWSSGYGYGKHWDVSLIPQKGKSFVLSPLEFLWHPGEMLVQWVFSPAALSARKSLVPSLSD